MEIPDEFDKAMDQALEGVLRSVRFKVEHGHCTRYEAAKVVLEAVGAGLYDFLASSTSFDVLLSVATNGNTSTERDQLKQEVESLRRVLAETHELLAGFAKPGLEFDNEGICVYCDLQWIEGEPPTVEQHKPTCLWRRANEAIQEAHQAGDGKDPEQVGEDVQK